MISTLKVLTWPAPHVIFEVGACEGEDTELYAREFPRARFWIFEPLPANFDKLKEVLLRHPEIKAKAFRLALSDGSGTATFHVSSAGSAEMAAAGNRSSSLLAPRNDRPASLQWLEFSEAIQVQTETFDSFCKSNDVRRIDFVHMDVQGAELKVLSGAASMLPRIRAIWMEVAFEPTYEGQPLEAHVTRWMADRGFRKIHQVSYGPEGDALFYNMRFPLAWPRFIALRMLQRVGLVAR